MKVLRNSAGSFRCTDDLLPSLEAFCDLVTGNPFLLRPFRGTNDEAERVFAASGFRLYPTITKTTLVYDVRTDTFFKILHPLSLKYRILFPLTNRARSLYLRSQDLLSRGLKVSPVVGYGRLGQGKMPFFIMRRIGGRSLYDRVVNDHEKITAETILRILDDLAPFHRYGFWMRDLHLRHIFIDQGAVSGFLEIDSIKRNIPFRMANLARDLAWVAHPHLSLSEEEKARSLDYYMEKAGIRRREKFLAVFESYEERKRRKWSAAARLLKTQGGGDARTVQEKIR